MMHIVLDAAPLGLLTQRPHATGAEQCRAWLDQLLARQHPVLIPEITDFEVRRELIRSGKLASIGRLDILISRPQISYVPLRTSALRLAATLWAQARSSGRPTADHHALDADVILCAQVLDLGLPPADITVATSNPRHISHFLPARPWQDIQ